MAVGISTGQSGDDDFGQIFGAVVVVSFHESDCEGVCDAYCGRVLSEQNPEPQLLMLTLQRVCDAYWCGILGNSNPAILTGSCFTHPDGFSDLFICPTFGPQSISSGCFRFCYPEQKDDGESEKN